MSKKGWANAPTKLTYCNGKPSYDKRGAQTARNKRMRDGRVKLRIYPCKLCAGWHLTSKKFEKSYNYK